MGKQIPVQHEIVLAMGTQSGGELCREVMSSRSPKVVKQRPGAVGQRFPHRLRIWARCLQGTTLGFYAMREAKASVKELLLEVTGVNFFSKAPAWNHLRPACR